MPSIQTHPCNCYGCNKTGSKLFSNSWWCDDHYSSVYLVRGRIYSAKSKHAGLVTKVDKHGRVDIEDPKILQKFMDLHAAYDSRKSIDSSVATEVHKLSSQSADVFLQEMRSRGHEIKLYKNTDYGHRKALRTISCAYRRVARTAVIADAQRSLNAGILSENEIYEAVERQCKNIDDDVDAHLAIADIF